MNWKKVKEKYPKAWEKLCVDRGKEVAVKLNFASKNIRFLYDFFDEQDILIYLDPCACHSPSLWNYCILRHEEEYFNGFTEEKTRIDVETIAFTKAFELLENQQEVCIFFGTNKCLNGCMTDNCPQHPSNQ